MSKVEILPKVVNSHHLHEHFGDLDQQRQASALGMWAFLLTEVMFFGGMFTAYTVYRVSYPAAFEAGSQRMYFYAGTLNTIVLICSSLTMALATNEAEKGRNKQVAWYLIATVFLGLVFLGIKGYEYTGHWNEHLVPGRTFQWDGPDPHHAEMFFNLYFAMTGFHALHMVIGIGIVSVMIYMALKKRFTPEYHSPIEVTGLYWHFVDIIWIFLYPLLYLIAHKHM